MTTTQTRFDPDPAKPYGTCVTCSRELQTEEDGRAHMAETMAAALDHRSHTISPSNPPSEDRIRNAVTTVITDKIDEAMEDLDDMVRRGEVTEEEVTAALRYASVDPDDAWLDYIEANS